MRVEFHIPAQTAELLRKLFRTNNCRDCHFCKAVPSDAVFVEIDGMRAVQGQRYCLYWSWAMDGDKGLDEMGCGRWTAKD